MAVVRGLHLGRAITLFAAILLIGVAAIAWVLFGDHGHDGRAEAASALTLENIPFDGARAYGYLKQLCDIGPRPSGSPGMQRQQKLLAEHFQKLGGQVEFQRFRVRHPKNSSSVPMANMIVRWHPENPNRILLCAHYDTLPFPCRDAQNPRGRFVGANDNASGVALLMELAHEMKTLPSKYGVDFSLVDAEEFVFDEGKDRFFLGSEYFAREYAKKKPQHPYRWGVLLDMIGDADLQIPQEANSRSWPDTRPLVDEIWAVAARLGVKEFQRKLGYEMSDDHIPLHDIGHIPCIDLIDFDYPDSRAAFWHTQLDTPDKCSALSLAKVGWVLRQWLQSAQ